jgi:voltage-gated potassium channel
MACHPLMTATGLALLLAIIFSCIFYLFERPYATPPYDTYVSTIKQIPILIMSGYDVEPPQSTAALICSYILMIIGIVYVTLFTGVVATLLIETHMQKGLTMNKVKFTDHILVCGGVPRVRHILAQLFSDDIKDQRPVVLIDPSYDQTPMDHPLLRVIKGNPTDVQILDRANARHARAAIVLADSAESDPNTEDARNLLIALAIETLQPEIYSCVEVLNPDNVIHFNRVNVDEIISVSDISNLLVIQSALNPGISRFLGEILSFSEGDEVYGLGVPQSYVGRTFAELATEMVNKHNMVLMGLVSDGRVVSQPAGCRLGKDDKIFVLAESEPGDLNKILK